MNTWVTANLWLAPIGLAALLFFGGCTTVPVTGRHELNLVSSGDEIQLGLSSFDQLKKDTPISHDAAMNAVVQRVGKRIAEVAGKDLPGAQWEFVVFDSKEANAFCLPGGRRWVSTREYCPSPRRMRDWPQFSVMRSGMRWHTMAPPA